MYIPGAGPKDVSLLGQLLPLVLAGRFCIGAEVNDLGQICSMTFQGITGLLRT